MKKLLMAFLASAVLTSASAMASSEEVGLISFEDFQSYDTTIVLGPATDNTEYFITAPQSGTEAKSKLQNRPVNGPGSVYDNDYEGNAAENIPIFAKTSDTTAEAIFGGLNNGWHGFYSHVGTDLFGAAGAGETYNAWNRVNSVLGSGTDKYLNLAASQNGYVSTASWYGKDSLDISRPLVWETDVKVATAYKDVGFSLYLANGKFLPAKYFVHVRDKMGAGFTASNPVVYFRGDNKVFILGQEAGTYEKNKYYHVKIRFDAIGSEMYASEIEIEDNATGTVVAELAEKTLVEGITSEESIAVLYESQNDRSSTATTEVNIDNLKLKHMIFAASIKSTAAVNINGKGVCVIDFNDNMDETTLNNNTVKVYKDDVLVEGTTVEKQGSNAKRAKLTLPELDPQAKYKVVVRNVKSTGGLAADDVLYFTAKDRVALSNVKKNAGNVSFKITNNAAGSSTVTVLAVSRIDGKIVENGVQMKMITLEGGKNSTETIDILAEGVVDTTLYVIDDLGAFRAEAPEA